MRKTLLCGLMLAALALACNAQSFLTLTLGTNRLAATTTNSTASDPIFVSGVDLVNVSWTFTGATNTSTNGIGTAGTTTIRFYGSPDGVTYYNHPVDTNYVMVAATAGTAGVTNLTTLDTTMFQYLKVVSQENTATNTVASNFVVRVWWKKPA